ncbi:MAG TPA: hypothetical protein VGG41_04045 [Solirubrobacteraceae bacterium]
MIDRSGPYTREYLWSDVGSFEYMSAGWRDLVMVNLADGSRLPVRGASRNMHWRGGKTPNFVALLNQRAKQWPPL